MQIEVHFFNPDDASSLNKLFRLFREKAHLEIFHKESNTQFSDGDFFGMACPVLYVLFILALPQTGIMWRGHGNAQFVQYSIQIESVS